MSKTVFLLLQCVWLIQVICFCQPIPSAAIIAEPVNLPLHLQGFSGLQRPVSDGDGRLFSHNTRFIIHINARVPEPFAGQGIRGIPEKISGVNADRNGVLWAFDDNRFYYFDYRQQSFKGRLAIINGDTIRPFHWHAGCWNRYLLFSAGRGKFYCMDTSQQTPFLKVQLNEKDGGPYRVFQLDANHVLLTTGKNWYVLLPNGALKPVMHFNDTEEAQSATLLQNNWLFVWSRSATLYAIHLQSGKQRTCKIDRPVVRPLGNLKFNGTEYAALGGPDSLYLFNPDSISYFTWKNSIRQQGHKIQPHFGPVFQDKAGMVWIPNGQGIARFKTPEPVSYPWFFFLARLDSIPVNDFREPKYVRVSQYAPHVLVTTGNQLHILDTNQKRIIQTAVLPAPNTLSFTQLKELNAEKWIAGAKQGLFIFNRTSNSFEPVLFKGEKLGNVIFAVKQDSIFIESKGRLLSAPLHNPKALQPIETHPELINQMEIYGQDQLIAMTQTGLYRRKANGSWSAISYAGNRSLVQRAATAMGIHRLRKEIILYTDGMLTVADGQSDTIKKKIFINAPEIPYKAFKIVELDSLHIGLVYKNSSLGVVNIETGRYYALGMQQGWWGQHMGAQTDLIKGTGNDFWATFDGGVTHYPPGSLTTPPPAPHAPDISKIFIQFRPHPYPPSFYQQHPLEVSYRDGAIGLEMNGYPADSIEYCLWPFDTTWHKGTIASFTNLPGGLYTFKTRIAGANGSFSSEKSMLLKILPPFWKTAWFRLVASLILALTGYLLFRWRLHLQATRQNRSLQLAQSELKAIRSQMNPHFIFNCMTAIDGLIATGQNQKASAYLAKFSKLVRQVLQLSERQLISLSDELNTLTLYLHLEQLRMQDDFSFSFEIEEGLEDRVEIPPMLLQPFVENAIIHGLKSTSKNVKLILIGAKKEGQKITFTIEDNGIGRAASHTNHSSGRQHQSMGTKLTGDRLKMLEQVLPIKTNYYYTDLYETDGRPSGTRVSIELHYKTHHP